MFSTRSALLAVGLASALTLLQMSRSAAATAECGGVSRVEVPARPARPVEMEAQRAADRVVADVQVSAAPVDAVRAHSAALALAPADPPRAMVTGHVVYAGGELAVDFRLSWMQAQGAYWTRPETVTTDANGRFTVSAALENTHQFVPHPDGFDVFATREVHVLPGEHRDIRITLQPGRRGHVRLELVQAESGDPYPFPVAAHFFRDDGLAHFAAADPDQWQLVDGRAGSNFELEGELRSTFYRVIVEGEGRWFRNEEDFATILTPAWEERATFEVDADLYDPVVRVMVPEVGPVAELACTLTRPIDDWGALPRLRYHDRRGRERVVGLGLPVRVRSFRVLVDLAEVSGGRIEFFLQRGHDEMVLANVVAVEGQQEILLTPGRF